MSTTAAIGKTRAITGSAGYSVAAFGTELSLGCFLAGGCRDFSILFEDWFSLSRILIVGTLAYMMLVVFIRAFGERILSKMSAFDLIVTVVLGSTLATVIISKDVS